MNATRALALGLCSTLLVEALWTVGVLEGVEADLVDRWHTVRGPRHDMDLPIVVVAVDDASLERIPDPFVFWGPRFATAFATLREHGATVVGLDFLTKVSGEDFFRRNGFEDHPIARTWDSGFRRELFQGDVVLVASRGSGDGEDRLDMPMSENLLVLGDARARVGLDNLPHDTDGTVRRFRPVVNPELVEVAKAPIHALSTVLVLHHLGLEAKGDAWTLAGRSIPATDATVPIVYRGPTGTWPRVPFWKLTEPGALGPDEAALLKGAIVLVGSTHASSTDLLRTPWGPPLMPGVEVHANAVGTLLSGHRLASPGGPFRALGVGLLASLVAFVLLRLETRSAAAVGLAVLVGLPLLGLLAFVALDTALPVASASLAIATVGTASLGWRYLGEEREKRHLRQVFGRYVSDAVVADILSSPEGLRLGGDRRVVTVLFSDIRNFTTLSERLTPEETVEMLNVWFDRACAPILEQGGVVDKFIGDAVMAVFGAPVHTDDHADRAIAAARGLSAAADGLVPWMEARFPDRDLPRFDVGIGIHTGAAVIGNIGFERRTEYTAIGDAVNVASRLEGLTKTVGCRLLVSRATLAASRMSPATGRTAEMTVKGREEPVQVVEILVEGA
ncbi:MAG: adenylate/guanylate cyclase domain-containing protein [Myxococcales bacterium]|nr:adenylate/guanylate cyclase domain-containing protein [Myxococcales bacterium]